MKLKIYSLFFITFFLYSCTSNVSNHQVIEKHPNVFPDYKHVTVPVNIAPLNFKLLDSCDKIQVHFTFGNQTIKEEGKNNINISISKWHNLLQKAAGSNVKVTVYAKNSDGWVSYLPFDIHISPDSIDNYIAYRLIEPGYEQWCQMGIYQRQLSSFNETAIITNNLTDNSCVNCHSFSNYNPNKFMFHSRRGDYSGTFVTTNGKNLKLDTKTQNASSAGTYPMWHPSGNYIAFSTNTTRQSFYSIPSKKIEVYDLESDLVVLNVNNNTMLRDKRFITKDEWETFPAWSPDGKWLYYCSAKAKNMPFETTSLFYGIYRVAFDEKTGIFSNRVDTVMQKPNKSASFPRISPDGRYLLYTETDGGTFPIWHKEADLKMIDLETNTEVEVQNINSDDVESYHSWSSNGKWIIFSSRRLNGLYTNLYIAYFDSENMFFQKPFILPQKNTDFYTNFLKSFNIPEFIKDKVEITPYEISDALSSKPSTTNEK